MIDDLEADDGDRVLVECDHASSENAVSWRLCWLVNVSLHGNEKYLKTHSTQHVDLAARDGMKCRIMGVLGRPVLVLSDIAFATRELLNGAFDVLLVIINAPQVVRVLLPEEMLTPPPISVHVIQGIHFF